LWVAGADGSDAQAIGPGVDDLDAAWSPDGRWIAFHTDKGNRSTLSLIHPDGTGRVDLVRGQANVGRPAWSLDSNVLAFREDTTIYTVRRDGSDLHRVIDAGVVDDSPMAWTPDGRIVFWGDEHHGTGLYAVDPDGSNLELLFAPPGLAPPVLSPSVSPNGRWILLAGEWDNPEPLFLVGISGSPVFEIVNTAIASEPRWTPPAT
jgi:Tol biopolymer transport system component